VNFSVFLAQRSPGTVMHTEYVNEVHGLIEQFNQLIGVVSVPGAFMAGNHF
jgi:hypothetical protein